MMKNGILILCFVFTTSLLFPQSKFKSDKTIKAKKRILLEQTDLIKISSKNKSKILSGKLIHDVSEKIYKRRNRINKLEDNQFQWVVIYFEDYPTTEQIGNLESIGVKCFLESWTPPLENHSLGFIQAKVPVDNFHSAIDLPFVRKMDSGEYENFPQNNNATQSINANAVWLDENTGAGVKVAVLDSGLDTYYIGTELPSTIEVKDYSDPENLDDDVENSQTGHGTHVAGSVLARGYYSSPNRTDDGNGTEPFKGSAPSADLVFLKIGDDESSSASSAAMEAAMQAAVDIYDADIITMSYGGWYTFHDGSSSTEQKVDYIYSQGVPVFLSAGNSGNYAHHYSGTVAGGTTTNFIVVNTNDGSRLSFNLVWSDEYGTNNNLSLKYYEDGNNNPREIKKITEIFNSESPKGTQSKISYYSPLVSEGTYYLKVENPSLESQLFHIYFWKMGYSNITFDSPDPEYTIGQPASADHGFAVGAYVSRETFIDYDGGGPWWYGAEFVLDEIAPFSSRGPRVDNSALVKPNICAPGHIILSLRDTDFYTSPTTSWIDDDGELSAGDAHYYQMIGTSMATPIAAGAAALLLNVNSSATPQNIYDAIQNSANLSASPNTTWGYGKLDVLAASNDAALPVELTSFSCEQKDDRILLHWETATEVNNYGFEVERLVNDHGFEKVGFVEGHGNSNSPKQYIFVDKIVYGAPQYRLKQIDTDGKFEYSETVEVEDLSVESYQLTQNYPNPFNPITTIKYSIPTVETHGNTFVQLVVYDILGREVAMLVNKKQKAGSYDVNFDASHLTSGVYFYKILAGEFVETKKLILLK